MSPLRSVTAILIVFYFLFSTPSSHANFCSTPARKYAYLSLTCCMLTRVDLNKDHINCYNKTVLSLNLQRPPTVAESIDIAVCTQDCMFTTKEYIDVNPPYNLNYKKINEHLTEMLPTAQAIRFVGEAYKLCEEFYNKDPDRLDIKYPRSELIERYCNPHPQRIESCVRIFAMQECPYAFYDNSKACREARQYYEFCLVKVRDTAF